MVRIKAETVEKVHGEQHLQPRQVSVKRVAAQSVEFDVLGVDPSISNALRRTIHADVPTLAIETVLVANNTSVVPDEVFAHRLGLIPIWYADLPNAERQPITADNPIVLTLRVKNTTKLPVSVYARELQVKEADLREKVRIIDEDILLLRLAANQEVDMELVCVEGTGREHAKWSPVSVASYRLLPEIVLKEPIVGVEAGKLQKCFSPGVIGIEEGRAVVKAARLDSVSRECLRHPEFADKVELGRVDDHFIFNIETIGQLSPVEVTNKAFDVLIDKCNVLLAAL